MAAAKFGRVTSISVSAKVEVIPGYNELDIQKIVRSAKQRAIKKNVAFDGIDSIYSAAVNYLRTIPICQCCQKEFKAKRDGNGGGGSASFSIHRVIASRGYTLRNIKFICQECNLAIGECQDVGDVFHKQEALAWQENLMAGD